MVEATKDGLTTSKINEIARDLINNDKGSLYRPPRLPDTAAPDADFPWYRAFVRGGESPNSRNTDAFLTSEIDANGNLIVNGNVGENFHSSVSYISQWNPGTYFPEQVDVKIAEKTEARYPGVSYEDLTDQQKEVVRQEVFESGVSSFDSTQFQLILESKTVSQFRSAYADRDIPAKDPVTDIRPLLQWSDLDPADQEKVWRETYSEFYNNGNLVFDLSDQEVFDLTGQPTVGAPNLGGFYSFQYYEDTSDALLPVKGYLKPMELNTEGVWRRASSQNDDIEITDTANFYSPGSKIVNGVAIEEFDSLKIAEFAVKQFKKSCGSCTGDELE